MKYLRRKVLTEGGAAKGCRGRKKPSGGEGRDIQKKLQRLMIVVAKTKRNTVPNTGGGGTK